MNLAARVWMMSWRDWTARMCVGMSPLLRGRSSVGDSFYETQFFDQKPTIGRCY